MDKINLHIPKKTAVILLTGVFLISLDRFLKHLAINFILPSFSILNGFFTLNLAKNYNIAFSLPISGPILTFFIFFLILALILFLIKQWQQKNNVIVLTLFFTILGASSNLFDRIKFGYVIDYLDLKYFTVFNIADVMISFSICFLSYLLIIKRD